MLQETHTDKLTENDWCKELEGKIYFSHGTSSSRGVALILPKQNNIPLQVNTVESDTDGRIILINCIIGKRPVVMVNVYAPTKDKVLLQNSFLESLRNLVEKYSDKPMIIGGDFNICLNSMKDKKGGTLERDSTYKSNLLNFIEEYSLVDIWRLKNTDKQQFTWISFP